MSSSLFNDTKEVKVDTLAVGHPEPFSCSAEWKEAQPVTIMCHGHTVCSVLQTSYRILPAQLDLSFLHLHCLEILVFKPSGNT